MKVRGSDRMQEGQGRLAWVFALVGVVGCAHGQGDPDPGPGADSGPATTDSGAGTSALDSREDEFVMEYGDRTVQVFADPALAEEVARLFLLLEDLRAEAFPLGADTRLPIGWTTLSFRDDGQHLIVEEPDYDHEPEDQTRPDISVSLAILARQRRVLAQAGVPGAAINFDQHVLTIRGVLTRDEVMLVRVESPGGRMTGWRLTPAEGLAEADEVESIPVHVILAARPELLDVMLLPPGYLVLYAGGQLTTIVNEDNEIVWDWTVDGELPRGSEAELTPPLGEPEPRPRTPTGPLLEPLD